LDRKKFNLIGGAISLGHSAGAIGALRTAMLVHALKGGGLKMRHSNLLRTPAWALRAFLKT
jgi:acetyl-CoA acetyltransferase